jgi:DNA-directed RNA polymerase specialized sigma24 family protein
MAKMLRAAEKVDRLTRELEDARAELRAAVRSARDAGESVSEMARRLGVSRTRVQQLLRNG